MLNPTQSGPQATSQQHSTLVSNSPMALSPNSTLVSNSPMALSPNLCDQPTTCKEAQAYNSRRTLLYVTTALARSPPNCRHPRNHRRQPPPAPPNVRLQPSISRASWSCHVRQSGDGPLAKLGFKEPGGGEEVVRLPLHLDIGDQSRSIAVSPRPTTSDSSVSVLSLFLCFFVVCTW